MPPSHTLVRTDQGDGKPLARLRPICAAPQRLVGWVQIDSTPGSLVNSTGGAGGLVEIDVDFEDSRSGTAFGR